MRRSVFAALALAASASGALAQAWYAPAYPYYSGRSVRNAPVQYCEKLCERDTSPCDPQYFKQADGRCSQPLQRW